MLNPLHNLRLMMCAWALAVLPAVAMAQEAGKVLLVIGSAFVDHQGSQKPLQADAHINVGDRILTRQGAYVHIRMKDGGLLAIRPESALSVEVFDYNPASPSAGRVRYNLQSGVSRSVTGAIGQANKEAFRFNTPVAAIGVRGTDFVVATTAEQTRVSINQGAVVVAPLGSQCQASGFGPCSANALLLTAGANMGYVELDIRNPVPRLRQDIGNAPGQKTPAHPSEPLGLLDNNRTLPSTSSTVPDAVVVPPVIPSQVHWGRWNDKLENVTGATFAELTAQSHPIQLSNWLFGLGVDKMPDRVPQTGQFSFNLAGGDAYLRATAGQMLPASLVGGSLGINFGTGQFQVDTSVRALGQTHALYAAGPVDYRGYFLSDPDRSNAVINSVISADLTQVGSLFTKPLSDGSTLLGAIAWRR